MGNREIAFRGRLAALLLCLALAAACLTAPPARAQAEERVVRVGWYESPFNITDQFGRRSGYAYEYQRKLAAYTGWRYEYVEGSWPELMQLLADGEIDLMSDVSYTPERAEAMLFSELPMGSEQYYIFVTPDNEEIAPDDYATFNGKRVGVNRGSVQADFFREWAESHGVDAELVELTDSLEDALQLLRRGQLDAYIAMDSFSDPQTAVPVCRIGASDFFFAVNRQRPELLGELDAAMGRIQEENKYYNQQMYEKYVRVTDATLGLTAGEKAWLEAHGTIRVGYQDNYLAFCAADANGALTGALKDYLEHAAKSLENAYLDFEAVSYPTAAAAMEALQKGDVDCMFPANLTDYDGETLGVVMSPPLMDTEMYAVVRQAEQKSFVYKEDVAVAVNQGNPNYEMFLVDHFPGWQTVHYVDTPTCLKAVAAGEADCILISNYRFSNIAKQCEELHLATVSTGVDMNYCFALREGETALYSILARVTGVVPSSTVNAALTYYSAEDAKTSFTDLIRDNLTIVMTVIAAVLLVILLLLLFSIRAQKRAIREQHLVEDLNKQVYVDALTHVRNKGGFNNYMEQLQSRLDGGEALSFAMGVFDCDNLKTINDQNGHDKGDEYLKAATRLICTTFKHSPVFRIGGDEFAVVLMNEDYENREALVRQLAESEREISASAENKWDQVHVAMGIAVYDAQLDGSVNDTLRRADKIMYENKRVGKGRG